MVTFVPVINNTKKALKQIFNIYYLVLFNDIKIQAVYDLDSEINIINPAFTNKLGFFI